MFVLVPTLANEFRNAPVAFFTWIRHCWFIKSDVDDVGGVAFLGNIFSFDGNVRAPIPTDDDDVDVCGNIWCEQHGTSGSNVGVAAVPMKGILFMSAIGNSILRSSSTHFLESAPESLAFDSRVFSSVAINFLLSTTFGRLFGIGCACMTSLNFDDVVGITSHRTLPFLRANSNVDGFSFLPYDVVCLVLVVTRPLFSLEMSVVNWEQHALVLFKYRDFVWFDTTYMRDRDTHKKVNLRLRWIYWQLAQHRDIDKGWKKRKKDIFHLIRRLFLLKINLIRRRLALYFGICSVTWSIFFTTIDSFKKIKITCKSN